MKMSTIQTAIWDNALTFRTHPDLFSPRGADRGTLAMLGSVELTAEDRLLDLGCGVGMISEHISDTTGASVVGLDYAPEAVAAALDRTVGKRNRLDFVQGDMNDLELEPVLRGQLPLRHALFHMLTSRQVPLATIWSPGVFTSRM